MALFTFSRPPVTVLPAIDVTGSTLFMRFAFRLAVLREHLDSTKAAAPETCGVAIEVPLKMEKPPLRTVERMAVPGAPRSTVVAPKFEKEDFASRLSVDATASTFGAL